MSLINPLFRRTTGNSRSHHIRRRERFSPLGIRGAQVDVLENRVLLSAQIVTTTADSGTGSLRAAIAAASNGDTISFAKQLQGQTIILTSGQIAITRSMDIEGPGANKLTVNKRKRDTNANGTGPIYSRCFRGLPRFRNGGIPSRDSIFPVQPSPPYGRLWVRQCSTAASSADVCGMFTHSTQSRRRATGHRASGISGTPSPALCPRLDHRHASARPTRFARSGFRSTYRTTVVNVRHPALEMTCNAPDTPRRTRPASDTPPTAARA